MTRALLGLCVLGLLLTDPARGQAKPFPAETRLQAQARRRELLHQQLKALLTCPDPDVQRLGIVFHTLGQYDAGELLPLFNGEKGPPASVVFALEQATTYNERMQDAMIELLAEEGRPARLQLLKWLNEKAPRWRDRPSVAQLIPRMIQRLPVVEPDEERKVSAEILQGMDVRMLPHVPELLRLAEEAKRPRIAGYLASLIPWSHLGEQRDAVMQRVIQLMLRHESRWFNSLVWQHWEGRLTEAELDLLIRELPHHRGAEDWNPETHIPSLALLKQQLDTSWPGWLERPAARQSVQMLREEFHQADPYRQYLAWKTLLTLGETNHPEVRGYLLRRLKSPADNSPPGFDNLLQAAPFPAYGFTPPEIQVLLQLAVDRLNADSTSVFWGEPLAILMWMGPAARPVIPELLLRLERVVWDEPETFLMPGTNHELSVLERCHQGKLVLALERIDPHWKHQPAGRHILTLLCDRVQGERSRGVEPKPWEFPVLKLGGLSTPGLRSVLLEEWLTPQAGISERYWGEGLDGFEYLCSITDWVDSPEARAIWQKAEPRFPWRDSWQNNLLFAQLTLHQPQLSREQKRDYLLKALTPLLLGFKGHWFKQRQLLYAALDELDPAWTETPLAQEAILLARQTFLAEGIPDLCCWGLLSRAGAGDRMEFQLLAFLLADLDEAELEMLAPAFSLPGTMPQVSARLRQLDPDYLQSDVIREYRRRACLKLIVDDNYTALVRLDFVNSGGDSEFRQLPALLIRLARQKEAEADSPTQASRLLYQVAQNLRDQKIFDGPILLPAPLPAQKPKPSGMTP